MKTFLVLFELDTAHPPPIIARTLPAARNDVEKNRASGGMIKEIFWRRVAAADWAGCVAYLGALFGAAPRVITAWEIDGGAALNDASHVRGAAQITGIRGNELITGDDGKWYVAIDGTRDAITWEDFAEGKS